MRLYPYALLSVTVTSIIMLLHYVIFGNCVWDNQYTLPGIITSFLMVNQGWILEFAPALNNPVWYICVLLWMYAIYFIIEQTFKKMGGYRYKLLIYLLIIILGGLGNKFQFSLPFLYGSDCRGYATFFIGVLICEFFKNEKFKECIPISIVGILLGCCLLITLSRYFWYIWVFVLCPAILVLSISMPQVKFNTSSFTEVTFQLYL